VIEAVNSDAASNFKMLSVILWAVPCMAQAVSCGPVTLEDQIQVKPVCVVFLADKVVVLNHILQFWSVSIIPTVIHTYLFTMNSSSAGPLDSEVPKYTLVHCFIRKENCISVGNFVN